MRSIVLVLLMFWVAIFAAGLYGFGIDGLLAGLNPEYYGASEKLDLYLHWIFLLAPIWLSAIWAITRRRK